MAVGRKIARAHPPDQLAQARIARRIRAQHQRVDKEPTRSSSALSLRPAIGLPIAMSCPAPSRLSRPARHACSTMNRLAPHARASPTSPRMQLRATAQLDNTPRGGSQPQAAAGRWAARSASAKPASAARQNASCRAIALSASLSSPSDLLLPQRVVGILHRQRRQGCSLAPAARPIGPRKSATAAPTTSRPPAMWCSSSSSTCSLRSELEQMRPQRQLARRCQSPTAAASASAAASSASLTARTRSAAGRAASARQDLLPRHPSRSGKDRAQALVAPHHIAQRCLQRRALQRPSSRTATGICRLRLLLHLPPPAGAGTTAAAAHSDSGISAGRAPRTRRRTRRCRLTQPTRQRRNRRRLKQAADRHLDIQARPDAADQPRRQQRMTAQLKEIVRRSQPRQPPAPPQTARTGSPPAACAAPAAAHARAATGAGSARRSSLPFGVSGSRSSTTNARRHHVVRKAPRHMRPQRTPHPVLPLRAAAPHSQPAACSPAASSRAITAACATPACRSSTASISPGSMRKPRSFTCASARPRNSSTPSGASAPDPRVRYIRLPAAPNGSATNRSAVSPARPR